MLAITEADLRSGTLQTRYFSLLLQSAYSQLGREMSETPLISIVDDDALTRGGIRDLVESLGYNAVTFKSAEHFLESSLVADTTCLIADVQMPGLDGLKSQEALQSEVRHLPIILITAYPNEKHRSRALDGGAVGFLSKPFNEDSLIRCLTAAIKPR